MNKLYAGYAQANITPPLGINIAGYYQVRIADGILDELYAQAVAFAVEDKKTVMVVLDNIGINRENTDIIRKYVSENVGIPEEAIFITCTHTHTGPRVLANDEKELTREYAVFIKRRIADITALAIADLKPAKLGYAVGHAPRIAFVRRFRMKNGKVRTNPGVNNPDILAPIGDVDERVGVVRIDREGAHGIVIANFGVHPDVVGGCKISADFPTFARKAVEGAIGGGVKCVYVNGAQGDVNHVNVFPRPGECNGMFHDFDDVDRGYPHSRHMGNVIAGGVLQVYEKVKYIDVDAVDYCEKLVEVPSNRPDPSEIPLAKKYNELHEAGRDDEIPFEAMELTTELARATRIVTLENGPDSFAIPVSAFRVGPVGFVGFGGEPFCDVGKAVKENKNYELIVSCPLTNGSQGYFPTMNAYTEGGYEAASSKFKAGTAEMLADAGNALLDSMK